MRRRNVCGRTLEKRVASAAPGETPRVRGECRVWIANRQRGVAIDRHRLRKVADFVLASLGLEETELSVLLVSDRRMQQLNRQHLGRNRPTDVLAFAQREGGGGRLHPALLGDVVISAETAERQAGRTGARLLEELDLLLVHGILHLIGYEHTGGREEALVMERKQRQLLRRIRKCFPPRVEGDGQRCGATGRRIGGKEGC